MYHLGQHMLITSPNFNVVNVIITLLLAKNHCENIFTRTIQLCDKSYDMAKYSKGEDNGWKFKVWLEQYHIRSAKYMYNMSAVIVVLSWASLRVWGLTSVSIFSYYLPWYRRLGTHTRTISSSCKEYSLQVIQVHCTKSHYPPANHHASHL